MKRMGWKQLSLAAAGGLICRISVLGCYPLIPAYFAAVYLEGQGRWLLSAGVLAGMMAFLPIAGIAKYAMSILIVGIAVRLAEWVDKRCYTAAAALAAAGGTLFLSIFGGIFDFRNQITLTAAVCEALFIFGFTVLASKGVQLFLEEEEKSALPGNAQKEYSSQRLLNYAKSFEGLSKTFLSMSRNRQAQIQKEEMGLIQQEIAGRICSGCDTCAICWAPSDHTMYGLFGRLIGNLMQMGEADMETKKELEAHCRYAGHLEREAVSIFEQAQMNRAWYNRLSENREAIAQQLDAMAFIMQDCAKESQLLDKEEKCLLSEIRCRAREYGVVLEEIHLYRKNDGHIQVTGKARSRWGNCVAMKDLTKVITAALELHMKPQKDVKTFVGKETTEIIYEEVPAFHAVYGVARKKKDGAAVSGDHFSFLEKEDGELVLCLSDGMGFGERAAKESELVVDLLERFIEAGFAKDTAIKMLNSAMVIHGEDEQYSTVDITAVDLYTGRASFYKIGASATFIRHKDGSVECLLSTSLPVGVSFEIEIEQAVKQLSDGDFLVMITDGVLEYLHTDKPEEVLEDIISDIRTNHPGLLAKKILDGVMDCTGGEARDDMTVLCAAIWINEFGARGQKN